jgi:PAS domain S-box-containing protein
MSLRDLSLKWKLLIPFLLLSFVGTTSLVVIAFQSQHTLILHSERRVLENGYQYFQQSIQDKEDQALSLATAIALDPDVQRAFAQRDRQKLYAHLRPTYEKLHTEFGVRQIHFHTLNAVSFLRIHRPEQYGEKMGEYRLMIIRAQESRLPVGGLERGNTGFGIRGVVPVMSGDKLLGTVEVGFSFREPFLQKFKARQQVDLTIYVQEGSAETGLVPLASTLAHPKSLSNVTLASFQNRQEPELCMPYPDNQDVSGLLGPVRDFSGRVVSLVEIRFDRTPTIKLLKKWQMAMTLVEVIGLLASSLVVWFVVHRFLLPVRGMVKGAAEIVSGDRLYMPVRSRDETGQLAKALNNMVGYLEASRQRMKDYAENLEKEVQVRTRELRQSEEKYRSLVERVPLVVYKMTPQREITLVNRFSQEMLGVSNTELVGKAGALDKLIHPEDRPRVQQRFKEAIAEAREWITEYRLESPQGRTIYVQEHAMPLLDEEGRVTQVDGILVDTTNQKKLQEKTLQAEELKTLGEISARLAHEIRNPLTSIGGLSRRLLKELPKDHPAQRWVRVVVMEVQRLEGILQMILSYIQPVEVKTMPGDFSTMLENLMKEIAPEFQEQGFHLVWEIPPSLPRVPMDTHLLRRAMQNLCRHTLFFMDQGATLQVSAKAENEIIRLRLHYPSSTFSPDELDHYFYPFLSQGPADPALLDLPLSKIILHKHGALITVSRTDSGEILLEITMPIAREDQHTRPPEIR